MRKLMFLALVGCTPPTQTPSENVQPTQQGLHLATPEFTLQPGQEVFKCFFTSLPSDAEVAITRFDSYMTPGSHHYILYATDSPLRPDGTFEDCGKTSGGGADSYWVYASQTERNSASMPDGVALPLAAHQPVYFNMHYINATAAPLTVHVEQDLTYATGTFQRAGVFISYNSQISIPPRSTGSASGHCTLPEGVSFFSLSTHSHMRTVRDQVARWSSGQMGELLVDTEDWQHPTVSTWTDPYLHFAAGEELFYRCDYDNPDDLTITDGNSAVQNEMCMAVGYFFPATKNVRCLNSTSY